MKGARDISVNRMRLCAMEGVRMWGKKKMRMGMLTLGSLFNKQGSLFCKREVTVLKKIHCSTNKESLSYKQGVTVQTRCYCSTNKGLEATVLQTRGHCSKKGHSSTNKVGAAYAATNVNIALFHRQLRLVFAVVVKSSVFKQILHVLTRVGGRVATCTSIARWRACATLRA
jgi:hypothetical protein